MYYISRHLVVTLVVNVILYERRMKDEASMKLYIIIIIHHYGYNYFIILAYDCDIKMQFKCKLCLIVHNQINM